MIWELVGGPKKVCKRSLKEGKRGKPLAAPADWNSRPQPSNVLRSAELGKVKAASAEGPRRQLHREVGLGKAPFELLAQN